MRQAHLLRIAQAFIPRPVNAFACSAVEMGDAGIEPA